jgi:hypothetical protein
MHITHQSVATSVPGDDRTVRDEASREPAAAGDFCPLLMAAMRCADTDNATHLRLAFPDVWAELKARYSAPAAWSRATQILRSISGGVPRPLRPPQPDASASSARGELSTVLLGPSLDGAATPDLAATGEHGRWFRKVLGLAGESVDVAPSHAKVGDLCSVEEVVGHQTGGRRWIMNG